MIKLIDSKGKLVPLGKPNPRLAEKIMNGVTHYHYVIHVALPDGDGKYRHIKKRFWLPDDMAAKEMERSLKKDKPVELMTWEKAHALWLAENRHDFSDDHARNSEATLERWKKEFGADSTIEETTLAQFTAWVFEQAKIGKGRGGQLRRNHLLAIARWARSRGLVTNIPFEHSPMPKARTEKKRAATLDEFWGIYEAIPEPMKYLWLFMGLTGVRISAACGLTEDNVGENTFRVFTKFRKWIEYPLTDSVKNLIISALEYRKRTGANLNNVFCTMRGRPWNKQSFNNALKRKLDKTAYAKISSHQLRHMAGTILASKNLSADMIQAALAHDSRESGEEYIDQTMDMRSTSMTVLADSVLTDPKAMFDLVKKRSKISPKRSKTETIDEANTTTMINEKKLIDCPCGHYKILVNKDVIIEFIKA